jgi:hypothetical protein
MTKPKGKQKGVDPALAKAIKDLMVEVTSKPKEGQKEYSLSEKCKILDRFIKIESIRLNVQQDDSAGEFFKQKEDENESE